MATFHPAQWVLAEYSRQCPDVFKNANTFRKTDPDSPWLTRQVAEQTKTEECPQLGILYAALESRLPKSGRDADAAIIQADLKGLLSRLTGLETPAFNDCTPFADEVTPNWIQQQVLDNPVGWQDNHTANSTTASGDDDILQLEPEALADSEGPDAALAWLQSRSGITTSRSRWLPRLLMARIAEQTGKNELA